jgi:hypothetical protein
MSATANPSTSVNPYAPGIREYLAGEYVNGTMIGTPRLTPGFKPYVYRGTGRDELTPWIDDLPEWTWGPRLTRRAERMETLAELPLWHGTGEPPVGYITVAQAAEQLGVSTRTVERYKRDLAAERTGGTT